MSKEVKTVSVGSSLAVAAIGALAQGTAVLVEASGGDRWETDADVGTKERSFSLAVMSTGEK